MKIQSHQGGQMKMKMWIPLFFLLGGSALFAQKYFTAYNIWYVDRQEILTLNYKQGKLLPAGTEVDQVRHGADRKRFYLSFRVVSLGQRFAIFFWEKYHPKINIQEFRNRTITTKNFDELTRGMSAWEIEKIKAGRVAGKMSKQAVLVAYGYPPDNRTPSLEGNHWVYWESRSKEINVDFDARGYSLGTGPDGTEYAAAEPAVQKTPVTSKGSDTTPPMIEIVEPAPSRGIRIVSNDKMMVRGKAVDASGVERVLVNGFIANLSTTGEFWVETLLNPGQNTIQVKAADKYGNEAEKSFAINRTSAEPTVTEQPKAKEEIQPGRYFAYLIAEEEYDDPSIPDLDQPAKDAKALRDVLIQKYLFDPANVFFLENPDRSEIYSKFEYLAKNITANDNLLIFYAGHGYWDEQFEQGYWLPSNSSKNMRSEWISNPDIVTFLRGIPSKHTLLISDACFSGAILKKRGLGDDASKAIQELYTLSSRVAMTSGTMTEVPDKSVFMEYLVKRLSDNSERYLTAGRLFFSFQEAVSSNSAVGQVPQYSSINQAGHEGGDFIFIKR